MIPKLSQPLTKSIRTLEGDLVLGSNVALVVIPIVTSSLTAAQAVKYGVILNAVYAGSRSVLKGVATLTAQGAAPPTQIVSDKTEALIEADAGAIASEATQALKGKPASAVRPDAPADEPPSVPGPPPAAAPAAPATPAAPAATPTA